MKNSFATPNPIEMIVLLCVGVGFFLLSTIGAFGTVLSLSESVQGAYRADIRENFDSAESALDTFGNIAQIKKERDKYQQEIVDLKSEISQLQAQVNEDETITKQINSDFSHEKYDLTPARVIRYQQAFADVIILNKGEEDGVEVGDVVVIENYAIGEVIEVSKYTSRLRTLLSSDSNVPVMSQTGVKGILIARNGNQLEVSKVLAESEVKAGDKFTTLGINSNYPANLYVGEVSEVLASAADTSKTLRLKNELDFDELREVFILKVNTNTQ